MQVIVRLQDRRYRALITGMIRHDAESKGDVIVDRGQEAASRMLADGSGSQQVEWKSPAAGVPAVRSLYISTASRVSATWTVMDRCSR